MIEKIKEILKKSDEMWENNKYSSGDVANFLMVELEKLVQENE